MMTGTRGFTEYLRKYERQVSVPLFLVLGKLDECRGRLRLLSERDTAWFQPDRRCNDRNSIYFLLEAAERKIIGAVLQAQIAEAGREVLWLHDGFYASHRPDLDALRQAAHVAVPRLLQPQLDTERLERDPGPHNYLC